MNIKIGLFSLCLLMQIHPVLAQSEGIRRPSVIPKPQTEIYSEEAVLLLPSVITVSEDLDVYAGQLLTRIIEENLNVPVVRLSNEKSLIRLTVDKDLPEEAYRLQIDTARIVISSSQPAGTFWAVQTLHQLFKQLYLASPGQDKYLPVSTIEDAPRYGWRGVHLDVARHMFTKEYMLKTIERLSFYKINKLHLHLIDDQGWRVEIDKYPLLTEIGAWRTFDRFDSICIRKSVHNPDMRIDPRFIRNESEYGGYYTKQDIREIIAHAGRYGIEVIPEIDMPGHMSAAISAYPWLSCTGDRGWGEEFSFPICVCNPEVVEFAKDIYREIAELFPSSFLHIGADEVERDTWDADENCVAVMKQHGMQSSEGLQTLFVEEIHRMLKGMGKKTIVWDDAAVDNISTDIYVTFWRDWQNENAHFITQKGHPMIFMTWSHFYLSARPSFKRWKELYEFDITQNYPHMDDSKVIGYQACVWTEEIPNETKLEEHLYPALQAYCEFVWSNERDFTHFQNRMKLHNRIMDTAGIRYRMYEP